MLTQTPVGKVMVNAFRYYRARAPRDKGAKFIFPQIPDAEM